MYILFLLFSVAHLVLNENVSRISVESKDESVQHFDES